MGTEHSLHFARGRTHKFRMQQAPIAGRAAATGSNRNFDIVGKVMRDLLKCLCQAQMDGRTIGMDRHTVHLARDRQLGEQAVAPCDGVDDRERLVTRVFQGGEQQKPPQSGGIQSARPARADSRTRASGRDGVAGTAGSRPNIRLMQAEK